MKPSDFLTELSNDKLTQYKTAAAADASKADKEKDFARGDKRFSGIVKATKKQFDNDAKKNVAEGDVVPFPKKHPYELLTNCPKCGGSLQGGKDEKGRLKMCIPCMTLYRAPIQNGVAENVAGDVNSKKRYHFLYPHVPLDMHTDHEYNKLSDRDLQAVKSHQRELADKLGKPGAEEQSDIASHIQINRARSQYDQEQAHRRKVLDAEKIKRQARDAILEQGVAEGSIKDYQQGVDDGIEYFLYTDGEGDTIKDVFLQMKRSATEPKSEKYWRGVVDGMKSVQSEEQVEQGVAEGSETAADIDKKIEFHKQGQAAAQYKGSMNKMHAAKIRELEAKKQVLKQGVAEGLDKQALQKELIIINKLIKDMKNSWQQQHLLQKKQELLKQLKQGVAEADIIGFRRSADAISKQKVWQSSAASDSKQDDKTFSYQGYTINFTPDKLNIYLGGDLVLSRKGNFANPTKMQLVAARGNIGKIIDDKRRAALIRSVIQKNKGIQGVAEEKCPHCNGPMVSEELINEKKDACYYKVKSRYKVWPSAYASGALVKCRNKGANNWGNGGKKNESSILEGIEQADESLHDWFNKEKWVRMDTKGNIKGPCAKEPGEGKPKCLPQAKAHSLGKKGRASAAARKRREDPNPDRSGKAINVNTKKTKG